MAGPTLLALDEAQVARRVDGECLRHQLGLVRRMYYMLPIDALWVALALSARLPLPGLAAWMAARFALLLLAGQRAQRWRPLVEQDPRLGLSRVRVLLAAFSGVQTLLLAGFLFGSDDQTKLLAMLLAATYQGSVMLVASGQMLTYLTTTLPATAVMWTGWALRGGPLGWTIVAMTGLTLPLALNAVRQQRLAWQALVRANLEREALAAALAQERDRTRAAADARTRFFAAASHDLRQPLHALSINATTLALHARRGEDAALQGLSADIGRALAQSQGLLDALLDISRLDAGAVPLHLADHDLAELLRQLHAEQAGIAAQCGLAFELHLPRGPAWAHTDYDTLHRLLANLVDNALKFTAAGRVELSLERVAGRDGLTDWCIAVTDTGCGISEAERERVFEEFYQAHNPARDRRRGLGLGLAIVRRCAALLGADVRLAASAPGQGARFECWLPAVYVQAGAPAAPPPAVRAVPAATAPLAAGAAAPDTVPAAPPTDTVPAALPPDTVPAAPPPNTVPAALPPAGVATPPARPAAPAGAQPGAQPGLSRALTVLLVDDEADVLRAQCGLLRAIGWTPIAADGIEAALALAEAPGPALDAVVVDHRLPAQAGLADGVALVQRLRLQHPGLPALVVTGDVAVQWAVRRHGLALLHKPLGGEALAAAVAAEVAAAERWAARRRVFAAPPMDLVDAIHGRRSVRRFRDTPLPRAELADLLWHAVQVPRPPSSDRRSWAFVVVEGRDRLADFGLRAKQHTAAQASAGQSWAWAAVPDFEIFWGAPAALLLCARHGHPEAALDGCRAGQNLALLAHARGWGSCWIGSPLPWLASGEGRQAMAVPAGFDVAAVLALGVPEAAVPGRSAPPPEIVWAADRPPGTVPTHPARKTLP